MRKRILAIVFALCMTLTLLPMTALAVTPESQSEADFSDMPDEGSWSYAALSAAVENGLLKGSDGKLTPKGCLTRAQMAVIMARAFGATEQADISAYTDVPADAWYHDALAAAVQMKLFAGTSAATMAPDQYITRQQAFVVLARALKLNDGTETTLAKFSDGSSVSAYARGAVAAMVEAGYVGGTGSSLSPAAAITREQFAQVLYHMIGTYYTSPGTYTQTASGTVMVNTPGVTLKGMTIDGDLILGDGIGGGDVYLDGITVTGNVLVRGGGANSIHVTNNTTIYHLTICKTASGGIHLFTEGVRTEISQVFIEDGKDDIILEGTFPQVIVNAGVSLVLQNASVSNMTVTAGAADVSVGKSSAVTSVLIAADAAGTALNVASGAMVGSVNSAAAKVTIDGGGTVKQATISGSGTEVNTTGTALTVASTATGVTENGKTVSGGTETTTKPAASSGGSSYYTATVTTEAQLAAALTNSGAEAVNIAGSFALVDDSIWTKPVTLSSGYTLTIDRSVSVVVKSSFVNRGTVEVLGTNGENSGTGFLEIQGACTNSGTITLGGASYGTPSTANPGGGMLMLTSATLVNNGTITSLAGVGACWGGSIFLENASTLTNNAVMTLNGISILAVEAEANAAGTATLVNSAGGSITTAGAAKIEIRDGGSVNTLGSFTNTGDIVIGATGVTDAAQPEDNDPINWSANFVINKTDLATGSLTNTGRISVQGNGANALVIAGELTNSGDGVDTGVILNDHARINMMGTLINNGKVSVGSGAEFLVQVEAAITGNKIEGPMIALTFFEDDFREMLSSYFHADNDAGQYAYITMGNDQWQLELDENLDIPAGVEVHIPANCIVTIPQGVTMTLTSGAMVNIEPDYDRNNPDSCDGTLNINGSVTVSGTINSGGTMNVNGTVSVESGGKISIYSTAAFSNLMLNSGSTLTLTAGSLETKSEPEDNVPAIAQIWVNGGTLNAAGGSIAGGSTVYYTSGTMSLPSNLAGVSVGYRVISLEELTAALSDIRVTSVMIQDSFSASGNVILSKDTMVLDGATLTIPSGTSLTVNSEVTLTIGEGCTVTNNGTIYKSGTISGEVSGNEPVSPA